MLADPVEVTPEPRVIQDLGNLDLLNLVLLGLRLRVIPRVVLIKHLLILINQLVLKSHAEILHLLYITLDQLEPLHNMIHKHPQNPLPLLQLNDQLLPHWVHLLAQPLTLPNDLLHLPQEPILQMPHDELFHEGFLWLRHDDVDHVGDGSLVNKGGFGEVYPAEDEGEVDLEVLAQGEESLDELLIHLELLDVVDEDIDNPLGQRLGVVERGGFLFQSLHAPHQCLEGHALDGAIVPEEFLELCPEDPDEVVLLLPEDGVDLDVGEMGFVEEVLNQGGLAAASRTLEEEGGVGEDEVEEVGVVVVDEGGFEEGGGGRFHLGEILIIGDKGGIIDQYLIIEGQFWIILCQLVILVYNRKGYNSQFNMNLLACPTHPDRKQQMVCLSDECPNRFELRCVQCVMGSKCRQAHNWKMVTEAIEEMFELCETTEIKEEKKGKGEKELSEGVVKQIKVVEGAVEEFKRKIGELGKRLGESVEGRGKKLVERLGGEGVETYVTVKGILKGCKKDTEPKELMSRLKEVSGYITCGGDNVVGFRQGHVGEEVEGANIEAFQAKLNELLENLLYIIDEENEVPSQTQNLVKGYESQIDKLLEQVKQIPVLQNRIESLNEKLQLKDAKLKKYESGGNPSQTKVQQNLQNTKVQKQESDIAKVKRIQTLIDRRQNIRVSLAQHIQKNPQEELFIHQLKPSESIGTIQIPVMTNTAYLLNECSRSIADELQFLKYSDATTGDEYIEVPLISTKKQKSNPLPKYDPKFFDLFNKGGKSLFSDLFK